MSYTLYERHNKPTGSFPYIGTETNINYMSHYHEELEIVYTEYGSWTAIMSTKEIVHNKGDICIFMPGEIHALRSLESSRLFIFKISTKTFRETFEFEKMRLISNKITPADKYYKDFSDAVLSIANEYTEKRTGYEFAVRSAKNKLILLLVRELSYVSVDTSHNLRLFNTINLYLESNYANKISLEDVGALCHFSKYYFAHEFKRLTGMSFMNYLTLFRLEKAVEMLMHSDDNMTDIAMHCGFGNVRSFNRKFKECYGRTPLVYKRLAQKENT